MDEDEPADGDGYERFEAVVYKVGQLRCVDVPRRVVAALDGGARAPVRVRLGAQEDQSALVPTRDLS